MPARLVVTRLHSLFGLGLLLVLAICYAIYSPGLSGPLLLDDFWNLRPLGDAGGVNTLENFQRFLFSNTSGPTGRPIAMLSFLIDGQDWPPYVAAFKYTNVMLHLLTGICICWFALLLTQHLQLAQGQSLAVALLLTAFWLWHPFNVSTTLYVVQRMTQLMTLFSMAALICYLQARKCIIENPRKGLVLLGLCLFPFGLFAVLSKENGALLLLFIIVLETTLFRGSASNRWFQIWYRLGILLPFSIVIFYLLFSMPENLSLYEMRHFNLLERLLTEARILCRYLLEILLPNSLGAGLYHDDYTVSAGLLQPATTLVSIIVLGFLFGSAIYMRSSHPVYSFSLWWFFAAHLLESTYLPLELYFEHRNYLAMIGPLFAVLWYLRILYLRLSVWLRRAMQTGVVSFLLLIAGLTWQQASIWGNTLELAGIWATQRPASVRAQISYADSLKYLNEPEAAMQRLQIAHEYYPRELTVMLNMWNLACAYGLEAPLSIEQIAKHPELEYYRDDVNFHLQVLLENLVAQTCEYPDEATMVVLFNRIGDFPLPDFRRAGFHFYYSDLYVFYGRLNPALINLTRAFEANPIPQIPIRQAVLAASAGNFQDALVFLGRAREANARQNPLIPSVETEIMALEADIRRRLAVPEQGN